VGSGDSEEEEENRRCEAVKRNVMTDLDGRDHVGAKTGIEMRRMGYDLSSQFHLLATKISTAMHAWALSLGIRPFKVSVDHLRSCKI
jgi:hypothetical protein